MDEFSPYKNISNIMQPSVKTLLTLTYLTNYSLSRINKMILGCESVSQLDELIHSSFSLEEIELAEKKTLDCLDNMKQNDISPVPYYSELYPKKLREINDFPFILFIKGKLREMPLAAIIGSRLTSRFASKITSSITSWCGNLGLGVVSGLAEGVDSYAHQQAIKVNAYTIAVLPCSLNEVYPKSNIELADHILRAGGALVSELAYGIPTTKRSFVQRNRIQAALSNLVIPIEMKIKSGTMHTINFSKKYNTPVFLLKPTPMLLQEASYEGIIELISKPFPGQYVFENENDFLQQAKSIFMD